MREIACLNHQHTRVRQYAYKYASRITATTGAEYALSRDAYLRRVVVPGYVLQAGVPVYPHIPEDTVVTQHTPLAVIFYTGALSLGCIGS